MRSFLCMVLVGVVSCTSLLKNLPPNADVKYTYKNNKLVKVDIDYSNDLRPIVKSAALPEPTFRKMVPVVAPAAPMPAVKKAGATKTYYKVDDGQLERVKPTHVGYSVLPEAHVAPVVKSVPAPVAHAPVAAMAAPEPLRITGPQVILKQAPAPTARSVIIIGPQVIYKHGPAPVAAPTPVAAPVPVAAPAPVVLFKSAPAVPAPASPLIKTFWKQDDGELEKISPTHVSYSLVKYAPAPDPVPVFASVPVAPVAAPTPVVYSLPAPAPMSAEQESLEEED